MRTPYCEWCRYEDTNKCITCDGYGNDKVEMALLKILQAEREKIGGIVIDGNRRKEGLS